MTLNASDRRADDDDPRLRATMDQIRFLVENAAEQARLGAYQHMLAYLRHQHPELVGPNCERAVRDIARLCGVAR